MSATAVARPITAPRPAHAPGGAARPETLAEAFDPRANGLGLMRLLLAASVALAHACAIGYGWQPYLGGTEVGSLAVDAFFVLSGFLVTRSFVRLGSLGRYAWHRFLRIMPGFWVCLLVTAFGVAPLLAWLEGAGASAFTVAFAGSPSALEYPVANALLYMREFAAGGLPTGTHQPGVVDGSLWTLFYEATCYVLVAALGVAGALTRRRWVPVAGTLAAAVAVAFPQVTGVELPGTLFWRFFLVFGLGSLAYLFADRIPLRRGLLWVALAWIALALPSAQYLAWAALPFAYVCLYAVVRARWLRRGPRADLSYGLYVYHWPVETVLVTAGATALTPLGYLALALVGATLLAAASWHLVERPALSLKDIGRARTRS